MFLSQKKIRRTGAFNDRRLQQQMDEIIDTTNDAIEGIEQTIEIVQNHPNLPKPDFDPPGIPELRVIPAFRMMVCLMRRMPDYDFSHFDLQRSTSSDGQVTWSEWETIWSGTDTFYSDVGLDLNADYRYRVRAWDIWDNPSDYCEPVTGGKPGQVSLSEEVIGELADKFVAGAPLWNWAAEHTEQNGLAIQQTDEQLTVVANRVDGHDNNLTQHATMIQQNADQITLRAYQSDLDAQGKLLTEHGTAIEQNAQSITAVAGRTDANEADLAALSIRADEISSTVAKHQRTTVLESTITDYEVRINKPGCSIIDTNTDFTALTTDDGQTLLTDLKGFMVVMLDGPAEDEVRTVVGHIKTGLALDSAFTNAPVAGNAYRLAHPSLVSSSTFQQQADAIEARVMATDDAGNPIPKAQFKIGMIDEDGFILLDADRIIMNGTIYARHFKQIRNAWQVGDVDSIDGNHDIEFDFWLPSELQAIQSIKIHAQAVPFRAYAKAASGGGVHRHDVTLPNHTHYIVKEDESQTPSGASHSLVTLTDEGHEHGPGTLNTALEGGHGHHVVGTTMLVFDHAHGLDGTAEDESGTAGEHRHNLTGTTTRSATGIQVNVTDHIHQVPVPIYSVTNEGGSGTHTSTDATEHTHGLDYGIFEETTPAGVRLHCDNGLGYGTAIALNAAPDTKTPYELTPVGGRELKDRFSGPGRKRIKFTSTRRGRINFQIFITADLEAQYDDIPG